MSQRAVLWTPGNLILGLGHQRSWGHPVGRVDPGRADPGRAGLGSAGLSRAGLGRADLGRADPGRAGPGRAGPGRGPWFQGLHQPMAALQYLQR